jgi:hypothetical protein
MKSVLGDFNYKVGMEDISKPIIGSESLHGINNDNGVRAVNFTTSKNLILCSVILLRKFHCQHQCTLQLV